MVFCRRLSYFPVDIHVSCTHIQFTTYDNQRHEREIQMTGETVWTFETARFSIRLEVEEIPGYQYDGDYEDGSIQARLDDQIYVAFDSSVIVEFDGEEIGRDSLGSSVYAYNNVKDFWTGHRDSNPLNRNCSFM